MPTLIHHSRGNNRSADVPSAILFVCGAIPSKIRRPYARLTSMLILVTYDVATADKAGQRRLRNVAKKCLNFGQRVQNSVFECSVNNEQFVHLKQQLVELINLEEDSLRFYMLGNEWHHRVEHFGVKPSLDLDEPLIF
jgi:CRISPR-associated protein Cas2